MKKVTLVKIKRLSKESVIPSYAKDGDAGMDITATDILINTDEQVVYSTGIAMHIPEGYVGLIFPRSSVRKKTLILSNSVGVIDSGYRGEIQVTFQKTVDFDDCEIYKAGDRICQIIIMPYPTIDFIEVDSLEDSERGTGGHGSSGN